MVHPKLILSVIGFVLPVTLAVFSSRNKRGQFISDRLYCAYMNDELTDAEVQRLCAEYGVEYPPKRMENIHAPKNSISY